MKDFELCLHIIALFLCASGGSFLVSLVEDSYGDILSTIAFMFVMLFCIIYFVVFIDIPCTENRRNSN
jgi:hypothetical protein